MNSALLRVAAACEYMFAVATDIALFLMRYLF